MADVNGSPAPTVIVDDLHVIYRVVVAGVRRATPAGPLGGLTHHKPRPSIREVHAVQGISLIAYEGDAIGVVGRNGSGKSSLMRAIAGLVPAHDGAVYAQGRPSFLGVGAALMNGLTGERNVELGCLAMGMSRAQLREVYDDIVDFADIGDFIKMPMRTYSSGMGARLRFAIASARTHDVLLIDEALSTGDADFRRKCRRRIRAMREQAGTVFLVSHSMRTITRTCNRAIWIDKGKLRMDGAAQEVVDAYLADTDGAT